MSGDKKPASSKPASSSEPPQNPPKSSSVKPEKSKTQTFGPPLNLTVPKNKAVGCEHLFAFYKKPGWGVEDTKDRYNKKLDLLIDYKKECKSCSTCHDVPASLYLCLECEELNCWDCADQHAKGEEHEFSLNCRNGYLWCHACRDFIYDSDLERVRCAHEKVIAATSFRKRKRPTADEARYIENNSNPQPCKSTGLRGMVNFGNTCWISVSLLSLLENPLLRNFFMTRPHEYQTCQIECCLVCELGRIFDAFYSEDNLSPFAAMEFIIATSKRLPSFRATEQQDPSDFLSLLLGRLCEDFNQKDPVTGECKCILHQVFHWKISDHRYCKSCKSKNTLDGPLSGPLLLFNKLGKDWRDTPAGKRRKAETKSDNPTPSLKVFLDEYYKKQANVPYTCKNCKNATEGNTTHFHSFKAYPMVVTCYFPWMKMGENTSPEHVEFPLALDLKEFATPVRSGKVKLEDAPSVWYDLFFTTVHHGSDKGGHYVCYARDREGSWFHFNDTNVTVAKPEHVLGSTSIMLSYILRKLPETEV
ncbi:hypothetical protein TWF102_005335 [Orbilia oligospora]|uniref:ubiquitinyl hydrolase 1 n=1 Tax=Orbilia oligospora TaxID=2813651 RepID=A0A7C8J7B1_ORBOL|nr:hypothetical protein TWF102_005335 [Orbilia oligospora]KAF3107761.1 hypothetical protein TWF706_002582 [Orbilia oligospora]KAF3114104.1 hypothetical protein TWF103_001535 [Orbilia oligospora]KAF3129918.1 hypothetical protein TWF703_008452 [Orbilia oligospora]KAF3136542.1 hypothetical protein TWF594_007813 [Orbilia oligospora]